MPNSLSISLTVRDGFAAMAFYKEAFNAEILYQLGTPETGLHHGEFNIGSTLVFISGEAPEHHAFALPEGQMSPSLLGIEVDDCDTAFQQAVAAGAKILSEPADQFWGYRGSTVVDPWGYRWGISQKIEDVSHEELTKRALALFGNGEAS
ncbi:MAG: VOC family protein [Verrucomicrobiaceae bacterium]